MAAFRLVIRPHQFDEDIILATAEATEELLLTGTRVAKYLAGAVVLIEMYRPEVSAYILYAYFSSNGECSYLF